MRTQRKLILPLVAALVLAMLGWAVAQGASEGTKVLIDKDRNAVIVNEEETSDNDAGSFNGGTDLAPGLTTFKLSLDAKEAVGQGGGDLALYSQISKDGGLALGDFKVPLPPEAKISGSADGVVKGNDKSAKIEAKANFNVTMDKSPAPFTRLKVTGDSKTDYKTFSGKYNYEIGVAGIQAQAGVKSVKITLIETGAGADLSTALTVTASVDANSPPGQQIKQMAPQMAMLEGMMKDQLGKLPGLTVEEAKITKMEANDKEANFAMTLKVKGMREAATQAVGPMLGKMPNMDASMTGDSMKSMLALEFEKLDIEANFGADDVKGYIDMSGRNVDKFYEGYMRLTMTMQEQMLKEAQAKSEGDKSEEFMMRWVTAVQKKLADLTSKTFPLMAQAGVNNSQKLDINVEAKEMNLSINGTYVQDMDNLDKLIAAMKAANLPVQAYAGGGGGTFELKAENGTMTGNFYAAMKGDFVAAAKEILVKPAQEDPELKPTADLLAALELKDGKMSGTLNQQKIELTGYVETSDLTPVSKAALGKMLPDLAGTPEGARIDVTSEGGKSKSSVKLRFKEFMPGKSDEDVNKAVSGLMGEEATVTPNADAAQLALAPLTKPDVQMPAQLAALKTKGDAAISVSIVPGIPGLPGGTGGSNTTTILAIVVGAIVLIGIAVAASKKKA